MFKVSDKVQVIKVYNFLADTKEFIGSGDAYIHPNDGLPINCSDIEPPESANGKVPVFDSLKSCWSLTEDHRGKTVFDTENGREIHVTELGQLPKNTTSISPDGPYQKWNGKSWVKDEEAEKSAQLLDAKNQKNLLMQTASDNIATLQDVVDLGMATDEEESHLLEWKKYRVKLNRVDCSNPAWPVQPDR